MALAGQSGGVVGRWSGAAGCWVYEGGGEKGPMGAVHGRMCVP